MGRGHHRIGADRGRGPGAQRRAGFGARLSAADWPLLAPALERRELQPGQLLLRRGDGERSAFLLESGALQTFVSDGPQRGHRIDMLRAGTMVGEPALFAAVPRLAHVEAVTACAVWSLGADRLPALATRAPALVLEVLRAAGALMALRRQAHVERGLPLN